MKKFLSLLTGAGILALLLPGIASAQSPVVATVVQGTVTNAKGKDVNNAKVTVICNGKVQKTTTDGTGFYTVSFSPTVCPVGSNVSVTVTKGSMGGEKGGKITQQSTDLNVDVVNVSVPELGLITGLVAAITAGGLFLVMRRRALGQN
jgi:hypothetical protein